MKRFTIIALVCSLTACAPILYGPQTGAYYGPAVIPTQFLITPTYIQSRPWVNNYYYGIRRPYVNRGYVRPYYRRH